jgi:ribosomal protein L37AE/L43A
VFTFPLGALALVVLGVLSLAFVALGRDVLQALERWMSRGALRAGRCPACRMGPVDGAGSPRVWTCRGCAARFETDGSQMQAVAFECEADAEGDALRTA